MKSKSNLAESAVKIIKGVFESAANAGKYFAVKVH